MLRQRPSAGRPLSAEQPSPGPQTATRMDAPKATQGCEPGELDGQMAWTMVIFPLGTQTDDSKLTAQDITNFVNRGDIK